MPLPREKAPKRPRFCKSRFSREFGKLGLGGWWGLEFCSAITTRILTGRFRELFSCKASHHRKFCCRELLSPVKVKNLQSRNSLPQGLCLPPSLSSSLGQESWLASVLRACSHSLRVLILFARINPVKKVNPVKMTLQEKIRRGIDACNTVQEKWF